MQGRKNTIDPVPENVDIGLGSFPVTDDMARQTYLRSRPNQEGICSSSYGSSSEPSSSSSSRAVGNSSESFNAWNFDRPSSAANWESQPSFEGMKVEQGWTPPICASTGAGPSSAVRQLQRHHDLFPETAELRSHDSHPAHQNNLNADPSTHSFLSWESEGGTSSGARFGNSTRLSGSSTHMYGRTGSSSSSLAAWASSSCKRKALEGSSGSGQSSLSASTSGIPQAENFVCPKETASHGNSPDPMNSPPSSSWNSPSVNYREHLHASIGLNVREVAHEPIPPVSISMGMGSAVGPRIFDRRGGPGPQQEPLPLNLSSSSSSTLSLLGNSRHSSGPSLSHRRGLSNSFLDVRSTRSAHANASVSQTTPSNAIRSSQLSRNIPALPWSGSRHSRSSNLTSSFPMGGSHEEANSGSISRYISESPVISSAAETRNMMQGTHSWDISAGLPSHSPGSLPSSRRGAQSLSSRPLPPPFVTPQPMSPEIRRVLDLAPWGPETLDGQNSHLAGPSSSSSSSGSSSSSHGSGGISLGRRQRYHRPGFTVDRQGDELLALSESPLQTFASDIEGRSRVIAEIRQVLSAMRRGENLRAEDYMLFEPLMFQGLAEIHDRHRDMRLDVDNMSYEELLELGERIGDVNTGLKEETIMKFLKQHKKQIPPGTETLKDMEPCCICQEQYFNGEEIGELDCGHDFHVNCIKQWLTHKNLCPICKTTGLVA